MFLKASKQGHQMVMAKCVDPPPIGLWWTILERNIRKYLVKVGH